MEHFSGTMRLGVLLDGLEPKKHMLPLSLFCVKPWTGRRLLYVPFVICVALSLRAAQRCRQYSHPPYYLALGLIIPPHEWIVFSGRPALSRHRTIVHHTTGGMQLLVPGRRAPVCAGDGRRSARHAHHQVHPVRALPPALAQPHGTGPLPVVWPDRKSWAGRPPWQPSCTAFTLP